MRSNVVETPRSYQGEADERPGVEPPHGVDSAKQAGARLVLLKRCDRLALLRSIQRQTLRKSCEGGDEDDGPDSDELIGRVSNGVVPVLILDATNLTIEVTQKDW